MKFSARWIFIILIVFVLASYFKEHYSTVSIIEKAKMDVDLKRRSLKDLIAYCRTMDRMPGDVVNIYYRKGWDSIKVEQYAITNDIKSIFGQQTIPSFVHPLLFGSNSLNILYKKNEAVTIDYPYSSYSLHRSQLIFSFNRPDYFKQLTSQLPVYKPGDIIHASEFIYVINDEWLLIIH